MHVARSVAMLAVALGAALGLASTAAAAPCAGSGYLVTSTGTLQRFSTTTNAITYTRTGAGSGFADVAITPEGTTAYAADQVGGDVEVISTETGSAIASIGAAAPVAVAIAPDGARAYIVDAAAHQVRAITTSTNTVAWTHAAGTLPTDAVVSADGTRLYVTAGTDLLELSTVDGSILTTIPLGAAATAVARTATTAYTANDDLAHTVSSALLGSSTATTAYTGLTGQAQTLALSPDGATLYIGTDATGAQSLLAVNLPSGGAPTPIGAPGSTAVTSIGVAPDGRTVYAASANTVAVLTNGATTTTALTGAVASGITSIAVCPAVVPGAPTGVTADEGDTIVDVTWNAPADTGGAAITGFTATATPGGATCTTTGATTCLFTGLRNGTAYTFKVAATNVAGTGAASAASNRVTPHKDTRPRALALGPRKVRFSKKGVGVSFAVTVDGPGVIAAAMSFKRDRACQVSRRVWTAGTYQVKCVMAMAGRTAARRRARTYTLVATFSPTNGSLASALTTVVVPRRR